MRILLLAGAATSLVACSSIDSQPEQRSAQAQATFDRLLAGRSPGRAEHCPRLGGRKPLPMRSTRKLPPGGRWFARRISRLSDLNLVPKNLDAINLQRNRTR